MNKYISYILILFLIIILLILVLVFFIIYYDCTLHQIIYPQLYRNKFKDSYFPPVENSKEYLKRVDKGFKIMKNSKVAILGLAYNIGAEKTYKLVSRIKYLSKYFKDYRVIIYCIDSEDDTYYILDSSDLKTNLPTNIINKKGLSRVQKMAKLRNICKDSLEKSNFNPDYILLQDCDLASALSIQGLANSISYLNDYDALFANGLNNNFIFNWHIPHISFTYYDTFAYKSDNNNINYGRGCKPFSVKSAFGGAGIYNYNVYKKFKYDEKNLNICEHVSFHEKLINKKHKIGINPSFLVFSGMQGETNHKNCKKIKYNNNAYRSIYDLSESHKYNIL